MTNDTAEDSAVVQPLLPATCETAKEAEEELGSLLGEAKRLLLLALPVSVNGVLMFTARLIVTAKVGRIGSLEQSQLALAQTTYNITGLSWVVGMASGVLTFVGAAHGASASSLKGTILQRGVLVGLATCVGPLLLWTRLPDVLALLRQRPAIAAGAAGYIWHLQPALLMAVLTYGMGFYLQAQRVLWPLAGAMAVSVGATPALLHLYVDRAGWGLNGAAAAVLSMYVIEVALLAAVVAWHNARQPAGQKPWAGFSRECLSAWSPYLAVSVPSCVMICLSWWASDGLTLVSGWLPDAQTAVAASGTLFGVRVIIFLAVDGAATAVAIRVGNALGAGQPRVAKRAVWLGLVMSLAATAACIALLQLRPQAVADAFTRDPKVAATITACLPCLSVSLVGDAVNAVLSAAIRGAGRQLLGSVVNFPVFWAFGVPLCATLALHYGMGVAGLWLGMAVTSSVQGLVIAAVFAAMLDWRAEVERSRHLVRSQTSTPPGDRGAGGGGGGSAGSSRQASPDLQVVFVVEDHGGRSPRLQASKGGGLG